MESNGDSKSGLLTAGGILSIVGAILQIISGGAFIVVFYPQYNLVDHILTNHSLFRFLRLFLPHFRQAYIMTASDQWSDVTSYWPILGLCLVVLGIVAVIGGISAIRKKRFGLSLAGAICALPSAIEGILAVIFIALGKREFRASEVD